MVDPQNHPKHDHATLTFPEGFLWGASTSALQVEGNNIHSDWWEWEQQAQPEEKRSGLACDQYHLYQKDFDLVKSLGHNAHRLSIEWSRVEPEEGKFDLREIEHYQNVLKALKDRGVKVMLTLHHFTNPQWLTHQRGWENPQAADYFARFVQTIVPEIKDWVDLWITINEPGVYMWGGYLAGKWPPQQKSNLKALTVYWHLVQAHKKAYKIIHQIIPHAQVGVAQNVASFHVFHQHSIRENLAKIFADITNNHLFYILSGKNTHDFLGLNYYLNQYFTLTDKSIFPTLADISGTKKELSDMGWEIYPDGIFDVLMNFSDFNLPIYITENGVATTNDDRRARFLMGTLKEVYHAIQAGVKVKGYFHWSLLDNLELADGFDPKFGLVEVDFKTQKRTPKPSAYLYQDIIKHNGIRHELMKFLGHRISVEEVLKEK